MTENKGNLKDTYFSKWIDADGEGSFFTRAWRRRTCWLAAFITLVILGAGAWFFAELRIDNAEAKAEAVEPNEVERLLNSGFLSLDPNAPGELCEHIGTWDSLEEAKEFFAKGYYDTKKYGRVYTDPYLYEKETGRKLTPSDKRHFGISVDE